MRPNFRVDFFLFRKIFKGISFVKLKVSSIFGENGGKSNLREFLLKGAFFYRDRSRVLSHPRSRPPTLLIVVSGGTEYTTPLKLIVNSEGRGTTPQKLIVDSEVRGTTPLKLIMDESEVKVK